MPVPARVCRDHATVDAPIQRQRNRDRTREIPYTNASPSRPEAMAAECVVAFAGSLRRNFSAVSGGPAADGL
jgi:hypothetical protein